MLRLGWRRILSELYRIRTRLLLANLLLVALPIGGLWFARLFEDEALRALETDMIHQAEVLRPLLLQGAGAAAWARHEPLLEAGALYTRTRIRLLDPAGHVVADSHRQGPPEGPEPPAPTLLMRSAAPAARHHAEPTVELGERPEVRKALEGRYGATTRKYERRGILFLFSALPVARDGKTLGAIYVTRSSRPVLSALYRLRRGLVVLSVAAGGAAVVISLLFAWTIARRLGRLRAAAGRIAAGDRTVQLDTRGKDEIAELARAFDAMTQELDARARYIGDFAANVSHEFKSPLTSIRGAAELLAEGACDDDPVARARFLQNILGDAARLDRLVTRLLDLSRIEAAPEALEVLDYERLVRGLAQKRQGVVLRFAASSTHVRGNVLHLESALGNLLDNACRYAAAGTEAGSDVTLTVEDAPAGGVLTRVADRGPGISKQNLPKLWDRFFTTDGAAGGTGLGLAIVASVVRAHGGEVGVDSEPGQGATFWFTLPVGSATGS